MPKEVEDCVQSVLDDNPSYSESRAYAICWAQQNEGNLSVGDNPSHDDLIQAVGSKDLSEEGGCPEGKVRVGDDCIEVKEVENVPPSALDMSHYRVLESRTLAGPIEREELSDNRVRYTNVALLDRGVWTDAGSGQPTEYDPAELEVKDNAPVNIMHDSESDASQAGHIEAGSWHVENGTGYADVVLDLDTSAGQYADETLQETLESGGEVGFGGPSIEIPPNGYDLEETANGYPKLVDGVIEGMGFVRDPASKSTSFARQTAERGVAMSGDSQTTKVYTPKRDNMSDPFKLLAEYNAEEIARVLQDMAMVQDLIEQAESEGFDSSEQTVDDLISFVNTEMDTDDGELSALQDAADAFLETVEAESLDATSAEAMLDWVKEQNGEAQEMEDDKDDEEEDEDEMDMEELKSEVAELRSELEEIREEHEAMIENTQGELSEAREELKEELAAAETVQELKEEKENLEKRLAEVEEEPEKPRTMADSDESDWEPQYDTNPSQSTGW